MPLADTLLRADVGRLERRERDLIKRLPIKGEIFLPTKAVPIERRIAGLERVLAIYRERWPRYYAPLLRHLRQAFAGRDRCFVIGNGPSLNRTDLAKLKDEATFAVNGFLVKIPELDFSPTFYVVEDHLVAEDRCTEINRLQGPVKLFPINLAYCLDEGPDTVFFNHRPRPSAPDGFDFSEDAGSVTYTGCTVTFTCMQLAFFLGFRKIYLIGVDFDYVLPADVEKDERYGVSVLDMGSDDPNHFHPDYFGKGRRWHDPQVAKMGQAYQEARRVTDARGVPIINATVGGKLEIFPRADFDRLFEEPAPERPEGWQGAAVAAWRHAAADAAVIPPEWEGAPAPAGDRAGELGEVASLPRVLIIDLTRLGDHSATGQLKSTLFKGWPDDRLMQVYARDKRRLRLVRFGSGEPSDVPGLSASSILAECTRFRPDVVYYRVVADSPELHRFALRAIGRLAAPLVVHIVDDWMERLARSDPKRHAWWDATLRSLLERATARLSIGGAMSEAFGERYGGDWQAVANGIDQAEWPAPPPREGRRPFTIRYCGALASDMQFQSVVDVARAVDALQDGCAVRLEIYTMPWWRQRALRELGGLHGVTVRDADRPAEEYRGLLQGADALLVAYNFDDESVGYVRYSMANKLPECLAAGVPVLAYGPRQVAAIDHLSRSGCARVVSERDPAVLAAAIQDLAEAPDRGRDLGLAGRAFAFEHHDADDVRERFQHILRHAAASPVDPAGDLGRASRTPAGGVIGEAAERLYLAVRQGAARVPGAKRAYHGLRARTMPLDRSDSKVGRLWGGRWMVLTAILAVGLQAVALAGVPAPWLPGSAAAVLFVLMILHAGRSGRAARSKAARADRAAAAALRKVERATERLERIAVKQEDAVSGLARLESSVERLSKQAEEMQQAAAMGSFQPFNRKLSHGHVARIEGTWLPALDLQLGPRAIAYLADRIGAVESQAMGRLAASTEDMVLRILSAQAVRGTRLEVLEIGVLFGVGLAAIHEACFGRFERIGLTALDPFAGYYGGGADTVSGVPVTEEVFRRNMRRSGVPENAVTVIPHLSTEPEALEAAARRRYDLLIIDGDHTLAGVKADFERFSPLVEPGGFILFDDYGAPEWPDVQAFVDAEVRADPAFHFVGADWRTAVFRVGGDQGDGGGETPA